MFVRLWTLGLATLLVAGLGRASAETPKPAAKEELVQRVYAVADLIVPFDNPQPVQAKPKVEQSMPACTSACCATRSAPSRTLEDRLIKLVVQTVAPQTWQQNGGAAKIEYYPLGMSLVVRQTAAVQEQIADLLAALRHNQDMDVAVEVRLVTVPDGYLETFAAEQKSSAAGRTVFLNDGQMFQFMEAMQGDRRTSCMQAPKLTVANGQCATVDVTEQRYYVTHVTAVQTGENVIMCPVNEAIPTGVKLTVQPAISADRRYVRIGIQADLTNLDSAVVPLFPVTTLIKPVPEAGKKGEPVPFTQFIQQPQISTSKVAATVSVPDGGTVLLGGLKKVQETRQECGPPDLSKIPYVSRLFKNVGYARETQEVLVLVTPRIIVSEEEETRKPVPALCPKDGGFTCPYLKEKTQDVGTSTGPEPTATVIENLEKLAQGHKLYKQGEYYRKLGKTETARYYYERVRELCPGASCAQMASDRISEMQASATQGTLGSLWIAGGGEVVEFPGHEDPAAHLVWQYNQACAEGRTAEAAQLAIRALAIDPTCFSSRAALKKKDAYLMHPPQYFPPAAAFPLAH
jgi:hypothetical protein